MPYGPFGLSIKILLNVKLTCKCNLHTVHKVNSNDVPTALYPLSFFTLPPFLFSLSPPLSLPAFPLFNHSSIVLFTAPQPIYWDDVLFVELTSFQIKSDLKEKILRATLF